MRLLTLPLMVLGFLAMTSCKFFQDYNGNGSGIVLDGNALTFIANFKKQDLYVTSMNQDLSNQAIIDIFTGDIILNSASSSAYGGNLKFVRSLSGTKAVYRIISGSSSGKYALLHYDHLNRSSHSEAVILSSSFVDDDSQLSESTAITQGSGDLYGKVSS
ncbi:hypothetical protein SAMN02745150_01035 [Brevinema andersonii]|uniref:Lipoprotein n=1 Tax=Brevinema andersonii TaxID=34097 RepID=A0A1I1EB59_BREAD|nr:hypothetical protein [Brevinema andersonii]SFB84257.1 hypothetical protein SAMN02745150_01035 [Brevinema andersonii]